MIRFQSFVAVFLSGVMALPAFGQAQALNVGGSRFVNGFLDRYRPRGVGRVTFEDSPRIERLMRAGSIYLSLRDAIALALENNLDIESARYYPKLALSDLQRASDGQLLRNVGTNISQGPSSASLNVLAGASAVNGGAGGAFVNNSNQGVLSGLNVQLAGSAIPNLEPLLYTAGSFSHQTQLLTSTSFTGIPTLIDSYSNLVYGVQQSYWTGTTASLSMSSIFNYRQNAPTAILNPYDNANLSLSLSQNLLNGFGLGVNKRAYHKARNNLTGNDLTFKEQVIATVANVVNLYWDLVSFNDSLKVDQQTMELDAKLYHDNQRRAELGAIAPIDIIQAEAEMKSAQQNVITQESQVLQQEMILKSVITRSGLDNPVIALARIVPTDHIDVPPEEPVVPVQDLVAQALAARPEMQQQQITMENARLDLLGTKNNLLPTLQAYANFSNVGMSGSLTTNPLSPLFCPAGLIANCAVGLHLGGYGSALSQVLSRQYPNYNVGFQLTVPLRNKANQADQITNELQYRQQEIQAKQVSNNIKLNVINAWTALRQARAAYDTAVEARKLQDQTLAGTRRKYELGTSTITDVLIAQRDDTTRQLSEVDALDQYQRARTQLEQVLGTILDKNDVNLQEAKNGQVGREPDLIPAVPPSTPPVTPQGGGSGNLH